MKSLPFNAFVRSQVRRTGLKKLRATGRVPATIYGGKSKAENLEVVGSELNDLIHRSHSENILLDLEVGKTKRLALLQEVQHHPLSGKVVHVDFREVSETEPVVINVPVETVGEAPGVKNSGGVLEHVIFKLRVRALPKQLPDRIVVGVTELEVGQTLHVGDLKLPAGVEVIGNKLSPVVSVVKSRAEAEPVAAEAAVAGEVEMTKEKKDAAAAPVAKGAAAKPDAKAAPAKK